MSSQDDLSDRQSLSSPTTAEEHGQFYRRNPYSLDSHKVFSSAEKEDETARVNEVKEKDVGQSQPPVQPQPPTALVPELNSPVVAPRPRPFENQSDSTTKSSSQQSPPLPTASDGVHKELEGQVPFCPYPFEEFRVPESTTPKKQMIRMFLGQLPYHAPDMQVAWVAYKFGGGVNVHNIKQILKLDRGRGMRFPTGCYHVYVEPEEVDTLITQLNDRVLVDDLGVWVAHTPEEREALASYCQAMRDDPTRRALGRPYGLVQAQKSNSR